MRNINIDPSFQEKIASDLIDKVRVKFITIAEVFKENLSRIVASS